MLHNAKIYTNVVLFTLQNSANVFIRVIITAKDIINMLVQIFHNKLANVYMLNDVVEKLQRTFKMTNLRARHITKHNNQQQLKNRHDTNNNKHTRRTNHRTISSDISQNTGQQVQISDTQEIIYHCRLSEMAEKKRNP